MQFEQFIFKYFWAAAFIITCINVIYMKRLSIKYIDNDPESIADYNKIVKWALFWMNLPWIVMGIGCTIGNVPTMFHFFRPRDGNPFVLAWFAILFFLYALSIYWIFFCEGAERLAKYGLVRYNAPGKSGSISNPTIVKLIFILCLSGGLIAAIAMCTIDIPIPDFSPNP